MDATRERERGGEGLRLAVQVSIPASGICDET